MKPKKWFTGGVVADFVWKHPGVAVVIFISMGVLDGIYGPFGLDMWT